MIAQSVAKRINDSMHFRRQPSFDSADRKFTVSILAPEP
jgi:hypothetical protein